MKCPYCGEEILDGAKKCKHCGEWLDAESAAVNTKKDSEGTTEDTSNDFTPEEKKKLKGCLFNSLGIILLLVMVFTCPKEEKHVKAYMNEMEQILEEEITEDPSLLIGLGLLNSLSGDTSYLSDAIDLALEKQIREVIEYHKYFIFSLSAMEYDNEGVLGIGVFGKVWIVR